QRQRHDAAFRGRVRRLTYLPVESGDRRGIHDYPAFAPLAWRVGSHRGGDQPDDVERPHEVDLNDPCEVVERLHTFAWQDALGGGDTGCVDQAVDLAELLCYDVNRCLHLCFARHVGPYETSARTVP